MTKKLPRWLLIATAALIPSVALAATAAQLSCPLSGFCGCP